MIELHAGRRYMILYRRQPSTDPLLAVLDYMETIDGRLVMSGRPEYGTQQMPLSWVIHIEEVPTRTKCVMNVRSGLTRQMVMATVEAQRVIDAERLAERHYEVNERDGI